MIIKRLIKHPDRRGFLCETFRLDELPTGLQPVMSYVSYTEPGLTRGPHEHKEQTCIFTLIGPGNFLLKMWDNRRESPTYLCYMELVAGNDNPITVIVPPGVVHGYKNISINERGLVINYPDKLYMGEGKKETADEIRHESNPGSPFQID